MKKPVLFASAIAGAMLLALSCQTTPPPAANHVNAEDFQFVPESLSISVGEKVTWVNQGATPHTSTSGTNGVADGRWDSPSLAHGDSFQRTFDSTGTFPYYCRFHSGSGMKGKVVVR
jgi:plastocyanin